MNLIKYNPMHRRVDHGFLRLFFSGYMFFFLMFGLACANLTMSYKRTLKHMTNLFSATFEIKQRITSQISIEQNC